jgi:hypothetical protein
MEDQKQPLVEDQPARPGVNALIRGVMYYLEDNAIDVANLASMNGRHEMVVTDVAEIIGSSTEQAEAVLARIAHPVEITEDTIFDKRPKFTGAEKHAYADRLYMALGRIAGLKLPDMTINGVLKHFPDWEYQTRWIGEEQARRQVRLLQRPILPSVKLNLPVQEIPRRMVTKNEKGMTIIVNDVTGDDVRYLVGVEKQLLPPEPKDDEITIKRKTIRAQYSGEAARFHKAKDVYLREGDLFTDKENVAMSLMTHFSNVHDIGNAIYVSGSTISRVLQPARERLGLASNMDLMLVAIAAGIASIDHVPKGKTEELSKKDQGVLAKYYSPDPEERLEVRSKSLSTAPRLSRIYTKLGVDNHTTLLYGVRDKVIRLPDLAATFSSR